MGTRTRGTTDRRRCGSRLAAGLLAALAAGCGSTTGPSVHERPDPIHVSSVWVGTTPALPALVSAHVSGEIPDACDAPVSAAAQRSGDQIVVTIARRLPDDAVCPRVAVPYEESIALPGTFQPGRYVLRVNDVESVFTVP